MKRKTILFISILQLLVITGCYDDLGNYDYTNSTKVSFVNSASSDYTFMVGDLFVMDAPINFSTDIGNVDGLFTVQWYLNRELIYRLSSEVSVRKRRNVRTDTESHQ